MAWIGAVASIAGGLLSNSSTSKAAKGAQYRPWSTNLPGVGFANFSNGSLNLGQSPQNMSLNHMLSGMGMEQLQGFQQGQQNMLGQDFLRGATDQANYSQQEALQGLFGSAGLPQNPFFGNGAGFNQQAAMAQGLGNQALVQGFGGYGGQNYLNAGQSFLNPYQNQNFSNLQGNMLSNFDPNQAASQYTNMLRQQALTGEQNAAASALSRLHGQGRLGTTGGMQAYQGLMDSQNQADLGRQIAGQQLGQQQQLMAQQGYDQALNAEQGRQLSGFGANQQGMMNQFGIAQGLGQTGAGLMGQSLNNAGLGMGIGQSADAFGFDRLMGLNQQGFDRANSLYTASNNATQDRFTRAMQLFGGESALNQQFLGNFQGMLGAQQSNNQQVMDLARIGASVGQAQTTANANAAQIRNQGNQDMIAGFLGAIDSWNQNRDK